MRLSLLLPVALLAACDLGERIDDIQDDLGDITSTRVIEGILLGVEEPEIEELDLSDTEFASGASLNVFLADASDVADLENSELDGASVKVTSETMGSVALDAAGGGLYTVTGEDGLQYVAGEDCAEPV